MVWQAKPGCPPQRREALERAVNAMPPEWLLAPQTGELFPDVPACYRRLKGYSLVEGFCIVRFGGGTKSNPGCRFLCSFHVSGTRNSRKLEDRVVKDEEGTIISQRKREATSVGQSDCPWEAYVSWKSVGKRNSGIKSFILTINTLEHKGHPLTDDPLMFPLNMSSLSEFQALKTIATQHRQAIISYSNSRRVLEALDEFGINLTARQYYNIIRNIKEDKTTPKIIGGLLIILEDTEFVYYTRVEV